MLPRFNYTIIFVILTAALILSCSALRTPRIQTDSMVLPHGSRVLLGEAIAHGLGYQIAPLRQTLSLPGITVINPDRNDVSAINIHRLVSPIIMEKQVDMAFILEPEVAVERGYEPYPFLKGWYKNTILEGSVYRTIEEPVYETRYKFTCTRTIYRVFQYDSQARLMGAMRIKPDALQECPETPQADIHFDEYDPAVGWILTNLRVK